MASAILSASIWYSPFSICCRTSATRDASTSGMAASDLSSFASSFALDVSSTVSPEDESRAWPLSSADQLPSTFPVDAVSPTLPPIFPSMP